MNQTIKLPKIAFIQANWHADIVDRSRVGFVDEMREHGYSDGDISIFKVPGAFEIPLLAKRLAKSGEFDAIVASGFVVDGGIYRHDFVATSVVNALMQVQLETDVPVFSVVLTPHHFQETDEHEEFFKAHFVGKGREAAQAVLGVL